MDVGVLLEKTGQFVPGLKPANFKLYENGVEQKITGFKRVEAPITALLLCEFSNSNFTYQFLYDMQNAAWAVCAAVAAAGLRCADDLRYAHADLAGLYAGQAAAAECHSVAA